MTTSFGVLWLKYLYYVYHVRLEGKENSFFFLRLIYAFFSKERDVVVFIAFTKEFLAPKLDWLSRIDGCVCFVLQFAILSRIFSSHAILFQDKLKYTAAINK